MSEPTLPGDISKLLQRGSPGWVTVTDHTHPDLAKIRVRCVVVRLEHNSACVVYELDGVPLMQDDVPLSEIELDLTAATGRAHAVWWMAAQLFKGIVPGDWFWTCEDTEWSVFKARNGDCYTFYPHPDELTHAAPGLATLDADDPRLLEDGFRWVDTEALRLACLHVAGRPL